MPVLAFVCFAIAGPVCAQPAPATAEPSQPAAPSQDVSYAGGLLQIDALDITLSELLTKVAAATGAAVDMPHRAYEERMHLVRLGPAPARQVIASLLSSASVDYMIQASSVDPEKVQKVLVIARSSAPAGNASDSPSESRAVIARAGALGETVSPSGAAPDSPVISAEAEKPDNVS